MAKKKPQRYSRTRMPEDLTTPQWQIALRRQYGEEQDFQLQNVGDEHVFSDFRVTNPQTALTYDVAVRGAGLGESNCSCPDFATNMLGTCKHIEFVLSRLRRRRGGKAALKRGFEPDYSEVWLRYGAERTVCFTLGKACTSNIARRAREIFVLSEDGRLKPGALDKLESFLAATHRSKHEVRCRQDVLEFTAYLWAEAERNRRLRRQFPQGAASPSLIDLLHLPLYPYQCEGALFAATVGRCLIADEMGLGKTVQAIAAAEILHRHDDVARILIICPNSLKHQWQAEIRRLTGRDSTVVMGPQHERSKQFACPDIYKITNYDTVRRDLDLINAWSPGLVIADEAQRIKNWDTKTARAVRQVRSRHAIVLTGTPLENRLPELMSIVQFVDTHRLGPTWQFLENHQIHDDSGRVIGYQRLDEVAATLAPIMIRRRKHEVLDQLPARRDKVLLLPLTSQQRNLHDEASEAVARIVARWKRQHVLSDKDQKRLMAALQKMRMVCDSTFLLDRTQDHGTKIAELMRVLDQALAEPEVKVVIFSQWLRSHELIERALQHRGCGYVLFHGGVPGSRRGKLVQQFNQDPDCRVFLSTDAGGVGLNLQRASVVMNLDLPWNPAVLEQRIGRAHRLGQHRPVQVFNFVAEASIEQNLLGLLAFKQSLASGVLDGGQKEIHLGGTRLTSFMERVERATDRAGVPRIVHSETSDVSPARAGTERPEDVAGTTSEKSGAAAAASNAHDNPWLPLISLGQQLLSQFAQADGTSAPQSSLIHEDPETGETYVKLPVPSREHVARLADVLRDMIEPRT